MLQSHVDVDTYIVVCRYRNRGYDYFFSWIDRHQRRVRDGKKERTTSSHLIEQQQKTPTAAIKAHACIRISHHHSRCAYFLHSLLFVCARFFFSSNIISLCYGVWSIRNWWTEFLSALFVLDTCFTVRRPMFIVRSFFRVWFLLNANNILIRYTSVWMLMYLMFLMYTDIWHSHQKCSRKIALAKKLKSMQNSSKEWK